MCSSIFIFVFLFSAQGIIFSETEAAERNFVSRGSGQIIYPGPTLRSNIRYQDYTTAPKFGDRINEELEALVAKPYQDQTDEYSDDENEDKCVLTADPPDPESRCCGIDISKNDRITGGNAAAIDQYPWLVQIEYYNRTKNSYRSYCSGFLISGRYVVSAAHCFVGKVLERGQPVNVILGDYDASNEGPDCIETPKKCNDGAIRIPIEEHFVSRKYSFEGTRIYNDIALVRLNQAVNYTEFIRPICLPTLDVTVRPPPNLRFSVAGWGVHKENQIINSETNRKLTMREYPSVKQHVDVPFVDTEECRNTYTFLNNGHICAGGEQGKDSCAGDSGSPLMLKSDSIYEAVGIVSTSLKKYLCGTEGRPAVYTKVYSHLSWINSNIKK